MSRKSDIDILLMILNTSKELINVTKEKVNWSILYAFDTYVITRSSKTYLFHKLLSR